MSSDNFLIAIPAKGRRIALYDVSASDPVLTNLDDLDSSEWHTVCHHVFANYADRKVGEALSAEEIEILADSYRKEVDVEYGTRLLNKAPIDDE